MSEQETSLAKRLMRLPGRERMAPRKRHSASRGLEATGSAHPWLCGKAGGEREGGSAVGTNAQKRTSLSGGMAAQEAKDAPMSSCGNRRWHSCCLGCWHLRTRLARRHQTAVASGSTFSASPENMPSSYLLIESFLCRATEKGGRALVGFGFFSLFCPWCQNN